MISVTMPEDIDGLFTWCEVMHNNHPQPQHFAGGIVDLGTAVALQGPHGCSADPSAAHREYCAAAINFITAAHARGVDIRPRFPRRFEEIENHSRCAIPWRDLICSLAAAQNQMLLDMFNVDGEMIVPTEYNPNACGRALGLLALKCFQLVPPEKRRILCCNAMQHIAERLAQMTTIG